VRFVHTIKSLTTNPKSTTKIQNDFLIRELILQSHLTPLRTTRSIIGSHSQKLSNSSMNRCTIPFHSFSERWSSLLVLWSISRLPSKDKAKRPRSQTSKCSILPMNMNEWTTFWKFQRWTTYSIIPKNINEWMNFQKFQRWTNTCSTSQEFGENLDFLRSEENSNQTY